MQLLRGGGERRGEEAEDEGDDELKSAGLHGGSVEVLPKQIKNTGAGIRLAFLGGSRHVSQPPARREIGWKTTRREGLTAHYHSASIRTTSTARLVAGGGVSGVGVLR